MGQRPRLLRIPWRGSRADVDDELRFHIDMAAADLVARGLAPDAARAEAERRFGTVTDIRDACLTIDERRRRNTATADHLSAMLQDLRYAVRSLGKTPMLTVVGSLTIMLGVGATTAMFSVVNGVLLRPLPYAQPDRLAMLNDYQPQVEGTPLSFQEFTQWQREGKDVFDDVGAWWSTSLTLTGVPQATVIYGARMSASVPRMLGVKPVLGRSFLPEEDGGNGTRAVMLSTDLWKRQFNADPSIIGRSLQLSGYPFVVVGVYPTAPVSRLPNELTQSRTSDYWQALHLDDSRAPQGLHFLSMIGRVKAGLSPAAVKTRIDYVNRKLAGDSVTAHKLVAENLSERVLGPSRKMLGAIFGAVVLVLLVACANVANLLLTRAAGRQREIAIRSALGASRGRVLSQLLCESVLRAMVGGALGVGLAMLSLAWLRNTGGVQLPRLSEVSVDGTALGFALAVSLLTGFAFGLVPALRSAGTNANAVMREGGRGIAGSLRRDAFRRSLIVAELVMSCVLLCGAGLLLRSFQRLMDVPRGFDSGRVITASVNVPVGGRYADSLAQVAFFDRVLEGMRGIPGVTAAAASSNLPVEGGANGGLTIAGKTYPPGAQPVADKRFVTAGYFATIGARMASGREFSPSDLMNTQHVAIVNEAFASR
jgi:predicted permease